MLESQIVNVRELLSERRLDELRQEVATVPEPELADLLFEIDMPERMLLFRLLPRDVAGNVFSLLEPDRQNRLMEELTQEETRRLLSELAVDDRVHLLGELPGEVTQKLLNLLSPEDLRQTRQLLGYPPESVGRLMTPAYVAVKPHWTVAQALQHVRARGQKSETIDTLYVVDDGWQLLDALDLKQFILAEPETRVSDLMDSMFIALQADQDREAAVRTMERYDLPILPVVDTHGVLVGIVTFDDVLDVAQEEATEDFHRVAAIAPLKRSFPDATFREVYRGRVGWLLALVFTNVFSGAVIASFEATIAANVTLVFFLPLLIASSGNAGSQAATLVVRAMAMGEVKLKDWWQLLRKEIVISAALGLTMAVVVSGIGLLRAGAEIALIVALTMVIVVVVGSLIGTVLPFLLTRFRFDPAIASAPLVTSLADIAGVLTYFSIATLLLQIMSAG